MTLTNNDNPRFLGIDLTRLSREWQAAGALLLESPIVRQMMPRTQVQLRQADGRVTDWTMLLDTVAPAPAPLVGDRVNAVELSADQVLERSLTLPLLAPADIARAVELEVNAASPFGSAQTVHGYASDRVGDNTVRVDVAITSRQQIDDALRAAGADPQNPAEVWVRRGGEGAARPIVFRGYGEGVRQAMVRRGVWRRLAGLAIALALLAALVVTPTALARLRAQQAQQSFDVLSKQAAPQIAQRDALTQKMERLRVLGEATDRELSMPPVLDMLTRALPDDASLTSMRVEGTKLVLNGRADDATALVQRLAAQPGVHDVRLASPATRDAEASKETFIIEMNLSARRYGPVRGAEVSS